MSSLRILQKNMYRFYFEKMDVWQNTCDLVEKVYLVSMKFPKSEKYNFTDQSRRSVISIMTNLAEGSSRSTKKDQAHFTSMAFSSLMELLSLVIITDRMNLIDEGTYSQLRERIAFIGNQLNALRKAQLK